jgi:hypothetical protein
LTLAINKWQTDQAKPVLPELPDDPLGPLPPPPSGGRQGGVLRMIFFFGVLVRFMRNA